MWYIITKHTKGHEDNSQIIIGPFETEEEARDFAMTNIPNKEFEISVPIEPGDYLT